MRIAPGPLDRAIAVVDANLALMRSMVQQANPQDGDLTVVPELASRGNSLGAG